MNGDQRTTAINVACVIGAMILFPPYHYVPVRCGGYDFILAVHDICTINIPRLLLQWLCVILVGGIVCGVQKNDEK